jgi:hypothetical protein
MCALIPATYSPTIPAPRRRRAGSSAPAGGQTVAARFSENNPMQSRIFHAGAAFDGNKKPAEQNLSDTDVRCLARMTPQGAPNRGAAWWQPDRRQQRAERLPLA